MKTVIEMAREAGIHVYPEFEEAFERFAELVRADAIADAIADEREACAELVWPKLKIWSEEEQTAMGLAFNKAQEKHGWYETLMAVGASVLKMKAEVIRARGEASIRGQHDH